MNRYRVITYHSTENGADDKKDYGTLKEAERAASGHVDGTGPLSDGFTYEGAIVYDLKGRAIVREYGFFPEAARPLHRP